MTQEEIIQKVTAIINELITEDSGIFLVELRIKPTNNLKVFLDADAGLPIDKLVQLNRKLYPVIEEAGIFTPGDFSLEVSSAGIDQPLKLYRQYVKNTGRFVEVLLNDGTIMEGQLQRVNNDSFEIEITPVKSKGSKLKTANNAEKQTKNIAFTEVKSTKVVVRF